MTIPREESLITAFILDGKGGGKKINWESVNKWTPDQGILWVHLNYEAKRTKQWFKKSSGLDRIAVSAMLAEESRPRCVVSPQGLLLFLRGVNLNPGQEPEDMVSIRIWIDQQRIITTRRRKLLPVQDICSLLETGNGPKTTTEFVLMLNDSLLHRIVEVMDDLDEQVAQLEEQVMVSESHLLRPKISDIRRQVVLIRRYLAPQREALYRLQVEETPLLNRSDQLHIREATDRIIKCIEDLDAARDRAAIVQEELASRLSEHMDKRMYLLSLVAVIFLPLSFLTGLLGINVGGIPGANDQWGFSIVCLILAIIILLMFLVFRYKKWL
ncbi:MAG: magnesium transporter CorA [Gammaproteobacteria bacterium RIFCSPHIGHO2_12_FULL_35_23]|nr:MAG: magnesium transporter CorA [Gammaproteobacteria bacterium RIFCSPHIGHO2_12_FULL_35_23]